MDRSVFVSHSYFSDEVPLRFVNKALSDSGIPSYDHEALSALLRPFYTGGSDLDDLVRAYRRGGRRGPTQEISDPALHAYLVGEVSSQDVLVVLWSDHYAEKFWARRELAAALSVGVQVVLVTLEQCPLCEELVRGVNAGRIPVVDFASSSFQADLCSAIRELPQRKPCSPATLLDDGLNREFLRIDHPSLGPFDIAMSYFTAKDMERFGGRPKSAEDRDYQFAGNVSHDFVTAFCHFLSLQSPWYRYRLPSENEWEYAARAGSMELHRWVSDDQVDREGVAAIRNQWGMWFCEDTYEWTSTPMEWQEYNGWVQPLEVKGRTVGPRRAHIAKQVNRGPGEAGFHPLLAHNDAEEPKLGFRLVRELRRDINLDQVLPTRNKPLAQELLLTVDPDEFRSSVAKKVEYGEISRYFRGYLEACIEAGTWDMAEPLLVSILMATYVPPLSMPPYLERRFRQELMDVFQGPQPEAGFLHLLDRLTESALLGREFAEVLFYGFQQEPAFPHCWRECVARLGERERDLLARFCGAPVA